MPQAQLSAEEQKTAQAKTTPAIDLRSDTVTKPTPEMRRAMAEAEVGDDVYGEDPTINRLEQRAAEIFGKEASIFVPTGSMGNTIAIKIHTKHGQEIICEERAHILDWEMAMLAAFEPMLRRSEAGRVVAITSSVVATPRAYWGAYGASKAALDTLIQAYGQEVGNVSSCAQDVFKVVE